MAIGNKAIAIKSFADISGQYKTSIYIKSYQLLNEALLHSRNIIRIGGIPALKQFKDEMLNIENKFKDKSCLFRDLPHASVDLSKLPKFERFYFNYCQKEDLFLNVHILDKTSYASCCDPITISRNVSNKELIIILNEIKESYISARYILIKSKYDTKTFSRINDLTYYSTSHDSTINSLSVGLTKIAFKECYDLLDKIANFLNKYLVLGNDEKVVTFINMWNKDNKLDPNILRQTSRALYGIYSISISLRQNKELNGIRNSLTHRTYPLYLDNSKGDTKYDFERHTIEIFHILKLVIINLVSFVNNNKI